MGIKKVKAIEVMCDGCGKIQVVLDELNIIGFTGGVRHQWGSGGSAVVPYFACQDTCLRAAILNVLDEENAK